MDIPSGHSATDAIRRRGMDLRMHRHTWWAHTFLPFTNGRRRPYTKPSDLSISSKQIAHVRKPGSFIVFVSFIFVIGFVKREIERER